MEFPRRAREARVAPSHASALTLLFLVSMLNYLDRNMLSILLPAIKVDLHLSDTQLGFITGVAFTLFHAFMGVPFGYLADRFPPKRVIAGAIGFWSLMTAACGLSQGFGQLAVARVLVAVGEGGAMPASNALIAGLVPPDRRARALSIYALGLPAGIFFGFLGGGALAQALGWRTALFVFGLPGVVLAITVLLALPHQSRPPAAVAKGLGPALVAIASRPSFRHLCLASALFTLSWQGMVAWLPSYFTRAYGLPLGEVGASLAIVLASSQAIGLLVGGFAGDLLAKRGARWYLRLAAGASLASAPFLFLALSGPGANVAFAALLPGFAIGLLQGVPALSAVHAVTEPEHRGVAIAVYQMVVNVVAGLGPLVIGLLSERLTATLGAAALGVAILSVALPAGAWSALHFWVGSRRIEGDAPRTAIGA